MSQESLGNLWLHCKKEWSVFKNAPMAFLLTLILAVIASSSIYSWLYKNRIEELNTTIGLYEAKLNVTSPDDAYRRMVELSDNLNIALDVATKRFEKIIQKSVMLKGVADYSWMEPICSSRNDTVETKRQILVYNLVGKKLNMEAFNDKKYCQHQFPAPPQDVMVPPDKESMIDRMEKILGL